MLLTAAMALEQEEMDGRGGPHSVNLREAIHYGRNTELEQSLRAQIMAGVASDPQRKSIEQTIKAIDAEDRVNVLTHARLLITAGMNGNGRAVVIRTMAAVGKDLPIEERAAERADVLEKAGSLITEEMNLFERVQVMGAVAEVVQAAERADVVVQARLLMTQEMNGNDKAHVIEAVAEVAADLPVVERLQATQQFVALMKSPQVWPLLTTWMNWFQRIKVMREVARVGVGLSTAAERLVAYEQFVTLMNRPEGTGADPGDEWV